MNLMHGISRELEVGFDEAVSRARDALQKEGFGVLTEIDVKDTLRRKLDVQFRKYIILGACNPPLAHRALGLDLQVGLLLPCNVIVYENDSGGCTVSAIDPTTLLESAGDERFKDLSKEVSDKLGRVMNSI
jgi:uncharacterized protein (DUF302 family)